MQERGSGNAFSGPPIGLGAPSRRGTLLIMVTVSVRQTSRHNRNERVASVLMLAKGCRIRDGKFDNGTFVSVCHGAEDRPAATKRLGRAGFMSFWGSGNNGTGWHNSRHLSAILVVRAKFACLPCLQILAKIDFWFRSRRFRDRALVRYDFPNFGEARHNFPEFGALFIMFSVSSLPSSFFILPSRAVGTVAPICRDALPPRTKVAKIAGSARVQSSLPSCAFEWARYEPTEMRGPPVLVDNADCSGRSVLDGEPRGCNRRDRAPLDDVK